MLCGFPHPRKNLRIPYWHRLFVFKVIYFIAIAFTCVIPFVLIILAIVPGVANIHSWAVAPSRAFLAPFDKSR